MNNKSMNLTKVIVPCRFSYLHCWEPNAVNGGDPKYSVSAIIPKSDAETVEKIKRAIEQAKKDSVSKWGGKVPANLKLPLRDGDIDRPEDEAYADSYFFNASSCLVLFSCKGRGFFPGAFNSTKAILLPGSRTILSGTPSKPGETNFTAMPPIFFTCTDNARSILLSSPISALPFSLCRKAVLARIWHIHVFALAISLLYIQSQNIR